MEICHLLNTLSYLCKVFYPAVPCFYHLQMGIMLTLIVYVHQVLCSEEFGA